MFKTWKICESSCESINGGLATVGETHTHNVEGENEESRSSAFLIVLFSHNLRFLCVIFEWDESEAKTRPKGGSVNQRKLVTRCFFRLQSLPILVRKIPFCPAKGRDKP